MDKEFLKKVLTKSLMYDRIKTEIKRKKEKKNDDLRTGTDV